MDFEQYALPEDTIAVTFDSNLLYELVQYKLEINSPI